MTTVICGSVAGQGMFLPTDEDGGYAEVGYLTSRYGSGFGMGLGTTKGGFELGIAADFVDGNYGSSTAIGLFVTLDAKRLGRIKSPASLQLTGGLLFNESTVGFAAGPRVYVGSVDPNGWMAYLHGGVTMVQAVNSAGPSRYPASLGVSLGNRSSGSITAINFAVTFDRQVTTYTVSLSLGSRKLQSLRFDDEF